MRYLGRVILAAIAALWMTCAGAANEPRAAQLVVLDKGCEKLVQPYDFGSNAIVVAEGAAKSLWNKTIGKATAKLTGEKQKQDKTQISDEARATAKRGNWLPMSTEVTYGERAHAQETNILERDSKSGKKYYPVADALLADVLSKLSQTQPYEFKLFILKNSTRNALARPGGYLYLDAGLLSDPKQLPKARFAVAHEIAHVLQRHETRELQALIVDSFDNKDAMEKAIARAKDDPASLLNNVKVSKDTYVRHHIDQELQADSCAAKMLSLAYPDLKLLEESVNAFLADLAAGSAPAAGAPVATPTSTTTAGAPAGNALAAAPQMASAAQDIVNSPVNRHPTSTERSQNLHAIYDEIVKARSGTVAG